MHDPLGNPVSTASPEALAGVSDFVTGFIGYHPRAVNVLPAADTDTDSPLAQIYAGMLWMFLEAPEAPDRARTYAEAAAPLLAGANDREKMLHALISAWIANDMPRAENMAAQIVSEHPRDLAALKLGQYFAFNRGDAPAMLRLAKAGEAENAGNANFHAMAAFAFEQCHLLDKAEAAARRALDLQESEPWAHHALAHVMLTQGRVVEGATFLKAAAPSWDGLNSFMYTHNWWHRALFSISLGDHDTVRAMYDEHCWSQEKSYSQDQIGAVSLLARMEMAGIDTGNRWDELADWLKVRHADTVNAFLTLQYLYGLARAGRAEARQLMEAIGNKAAAAADFEKTAWAEVALPAARGILAHIEGRHGEATRDLAAALPRMAEVGGSHAQRDLFEQILLDAHLKAGNLVQAQQMLEMRRIYDPCGMPLNRTLASVYRGLCLEDEAVEADQRRYT